MGFNTFERHLQTPSNHVCFNQKWGMLPKLNDKIPAWSILSTCWRCFLRQHTSRASPPQTSHRREPPRSCNSHWKLDKRLFSLTLWYFYPEIDCVLPLLKTTLKGLKRTILPNIWLEPTATRTPGEMLTLYFLQNYEQKVKKTKAFCNIKFLK